MLISFLLLTCILCTFITTVLAAPSVSKTNRQLSVTVKFEPPELTDEEIDAFCRAQRESQRGAGKERMKRTTIYCAPIDLPDPEDI